MHTGIRVTETNVRLRVEIVYRGTKIRSLHRYSNFKLFRVESVRLILSGNLNWMEHRRLIGGKLSAGRMLPRTGLPLSLLLLTLFMCVSGQAQGPGSEFTIRTEVSLRSIAVRVTDPKGDEIRGLTANQFSVLENGVPQKIAFFDAEDQPVSLGILLDVSGSMSESGKLEDAKRFLPRLIGAMPTTDEMFLLRFHQQVEDAVDYTTDQGRILTAVSETASTHYTTRLYDSVAMALCHTRAASHRRRALVVITDGADQKSHLALENLIQTVQASETQVFMLGYFSADEYGIYKHSFPRKIAMVNNQEIDNPLFAFRRLAEESGAECFFPGTPQEFQRALEAIAHQLRAEYTLSYYPESGSSGFRNIEVRVSEPGANVRTRHGFDWKDLTAAEGEPSSWDACKQQAFPPYPYESKVAVKNGYTLYHDDFQSQSSGWPNKESFHYAPGAYQISSRHPEGVLVANGPTFGDFNASVALDLQSYPLTDPSAGLIFRLSGLGYYALVIGRVPRTHKYRYKVIKKFFREVGSYDVLPWTEFSADETSPIHLEVECRGTVITILHPGDSPSSVSGFDLSQGQVGMVLYGGGRATFQDLMVRAKSGIVGSMEALGMSPQSASEPHEAVEPETDKEGVAVPPPAVAPPTDSAGYVREADALRAKGNVDDAIGDYRQALRLEPTNQRARVGLQDALDSKGDWDALIALDREALEANPNDAATHFKLGQILEDQGDLDTAIAEYREVVRIDPKNAPAFLSLGSALGNKGDLDGAISACRQAIRINPADGGAHVTLGSALAQKGDWGAAIGEYRQAVSLNTGDATAHLDLGLALEAQGKLQEALVEFQTTCALDPTNPFARQNYDRLAKKLNSPTP